MIGFIKAWIDKSKITAFVTIKQSSHNITEKHKHNKDYSCGSAITF